MIWYSFGTDFYWSRGGSNINPPATTGKFIWYTITCYLSVIVSFTARHVAHLSFTHSYKHTSLPQYKPCWTIDVGSWLIYCRI